MKKSELIEAVAGAANLTKTDASSAIDATLSAISAALSKGDSVSLIGFGTFSVSRREARQGRNPSTGETIQIKAANLPKFKAGKALKEAVN